MSKIPFGWLPAAWGLKGKSRELAEAEYYLTGYDLDIAKARIEHGLESPAFTRSVLDIDLAYGKISAYDHDTRLAEIDNSDETALAMAKLDTDLKHNRISAQEHERKRADILNEPFMAMPKISWDPVDPSKTFFELDYNQAFVEWLRSNGYNNVSDEEAINRWLNDVCNSILSEMAPTDPEFVSNVRRIRRDDGITEHS
jgi:hypothetical protein